MATADGPPSNTVWFKVDRSTSMLAYPKKGAMHNEYYDCSSCQTAELWSKGCFHS